MGWPWAGKVITRSSNKEVTKGKRLSRHEKLQTAKGFFEGGFSSHDGYSHFFIPHVSSAIAQDDHWPIKNWITAESLMAADPQTQQIAVIAIVETLQRDQGGEWVRECVMGMSAPQVHAIVMKWLKNNPEQWNLWLVELVYRAMSNACSANAR